MEIGPSVVVKLYDCYAAHVSASWGWDHCDPLSTIEHYMYCPLIREAMREHHMGFSI